MREIKFRGMSEEGLMYHGQLSIIDKNLTNNPAKPGYYINNESGAPYAYMIDPDTIGQYTGLKDKNGKEIYEGDILKEHDIVMLVIWHKELASFALSRHGWMHDHFFGEGVSYDKVEVIGNKHEHPELLNP